MDSLCYMLGTALGIWFLWRLFVVVRNYQTVWKYGMYSLNQLRAALAGLLRGGHDSGLMTVTSRSSNKFIRFKKYIRSKGDYGIVFEFPGADWSCPYFPTLKDYCVEEGMVFRIVEEGGDGNESMESLHVDFGKNLERAHEFSVHVINHILGIHEGANFDYRGEGMTMKREIVIDTPETK